MSTPTSTGGIAILSDIHGNIDALGAVLADVVGQRCFAIFGLGDIIGYGPEPAACVKLMREYAAINLMGNHEAMYLATRVCSDNRLAPEDLGDLRAALLLCAEQIEGGDADWIGGLPLAVPVSGMTLVHGSLHEPPTFGYILNRSLAKEHFAAQETRVSFYGHTHVPVIWQEERGKIAAYTPGDGRVRLDAGCRYAIGVGSVGQPRDDDPRACYVVYQPAADTVEFRRVAYDIGKAQARFKKAGLPDFDRQRLAEGR